MIEFMRSYIEKASATYMSDLSQVPKDALEKIPDAPKRPPMDFLAECTEENLEVAHILRHETFKTPCYEGMKSERHTVDELSKLTADFQSSTADLLAAIEAIGDKGLTDEIETPEGEKMPAFRLATRAANHMKYHDLYTGVSRPR
jgi:hypothetical protein